MNLLKRKDEKEGIITMCEFRKTIESDLIPERLTTRLVDSNKFKGTVRNTEFEVKENRFFSNENLFPVIKGTMEVQGNITSITLSFEPTKSDKIGNGIFLIIIFLLAIVLGIFSLDVLITIGLLCWGVFVGVCMLALYTYYCWRAYKKLCKIWGIKRFQRRKNHG